MTPHSPTPRPRWRDTLQGRLIASHVLVIVLALGLVLLISAAFLRRYERSAEEERLSQLAVPLLAEVNVVRLNDANPTPRAALRIDAIDAQADAMGLRILIVDAGGVVRYDTSDDQNLRGKTLTDYANEVDNVLAGAQSDSSLHYDLLRARRSSNFAGNEVLIAAGQTGAVRGKRALVIVSPAKRYPLVGLFLPRLITVAGISLLIASLIGYLLSHRMAQPVNQLAVAADAMAAGALEQTVPGEGNDEIGRLVGSFNSMSRQVSSTYRSQRELLANVAHELRTPLTSVQGYAQALRDGAIEQEDDRRYALEVIGRESERMTTLIGQLLDLARLESGQARLTVNAVSAAELVSRAADRLRPRASERSVVLTAAAPEHLFIQGDEERLLQVLSNLVSNAIRHTGPGGLVSINALPTDVGPKGGHGARIIVHDTGEGISAEALPRIFDRFERGSGSDRTSMSGFGLGLAIVKELVDLHGGAIAVTSEPGRGSTFAIDLSAASPPAGKASPPLNAASFAPNAERMALSSTPPQPPKPGP